MIDFESEIYTRVRTAVLTEFPDAYVTSEYQRTPSKLPCVSLEETNSAVYRASQDSGSLENHALVSYEVNVFSNKKSGRKSEARKIAGIVDAEMAAIGFTRSMLNRIPNENDATIYRIVGRYRAVVGADGKIYTL